MMYIDMLRRGPVSMQRNYLLDGLRGVAAILVMAYHLSWALKLHWVAGGYLAVDFFFILSGYVIASAY
ncbi:MAG: acyltransferase family protein, partial [Janthinobacterium lividum]